MKRYFGDTGYATPEDTPASAMRRIFFGTRLGFYFQYLYRIFLSRSDAVRGVYDDEQWSFRSYEIFHDIERYGGRYRIEGLQNLTRGDGPYVIVGNHMSTLETMTLPCTVRPFFPVTFVMKDSLVRSWLTGPIMRSRDPIVVGRSNPRDDLKLVLEKGKDLLSRGISVIIFPQAKRLPHFDPAGFNSLGVKLAKAAGVKAIPLALKTDYWGLGKLISYAGKIDRRKTIHFEFGEPMDVTGNGSEQQEKIVGFIVDRLKKWGAEVTGTN